ncbi:DUF2969 family protein [Periweissella beninensis]|uniref:DUF2969 family protein n=1 Tax=Periweissella beninensis TaxID=504936 RepID=A0ABT0VGX6_9LACO|nr:DUF2969 family protein [Periweissella beninensis]MBM7543675.1 hypothetical protein [Periweissella beninensis]MCM2436654.1 DUF2969 family protein [Periweissella beninensis]MCT4395624.1 DUF2969 family protein [Periweissella beninensis]
MAKKDKTIAVQLEEKPNNELAVVISKHEVGNIIPKDNGYLGKMGDKKFDGLSIKIVLNQMIAEYNLHG